MSHTALKFVCMVSTSAAIPIPSRSHALIPRLVQLKLAWILHAVRKRSYAYIRMMGLTLTYAKRLHNAWKISVHRWSRCVQPEPSTINSREVTAGGRATRSHDHHRRCRITRIKSIVIAMRQPWWPRCASEHAQIHDSTRWMCSAYSLNLVFSRPYLSNDQAYGTVVVCLSYVCP